MRVNASKTKCLALSRFRARCSILINGEAVEQVEKFKYLTVVFTSDGKLEKRYTGVLKKSVAFCVFARNTVTESELSLKTKLLVFKSIFIRMLTYGDEPWTMSEKSRNRVHAAEMGFLRVAGLNASRRGPEY
ncbi:unnamed protein product [Soboliphyme baturini]|uniref:Uncharacterized protein n=1 Tax=Soboliphyme baturini TaxID=241478 RepID=A0A183IWL6_9BILA|nr:unnamed protein product [Soboliphyme baturini]